MILDLAPVFLGVVLAQIAPGPNLMAVSSVGLGSGRRPALMVSSGVATGVFLWAILFALGIGALIEAYPASLTALRLIGGSYLLFLGAKALWSIRRPVADTPATPRRLSTTRAYLTGLLVVMTNPKAALMWVAVALYLNGLALSLTGFLAVGLGVALSAQIVYGGYALLFSTGVARGLHRRFTGWIEAGFGLAFGLLGARLILDGAARLRN